ncbi:MAG TPA: type IX secretion system protein PorQ [Bacteroidales bacterium]|nr:type IX secretion system protein PorQ [Bacteroidales bacterium]
MGKKILNILFLSIIITPLFSQTGGDNIYEFLNLTHSGLVSSLGGSNVSLNGNNQNLAYHNPALLNSGMNKTLALNYVNYFAGINYGLVMYSKSFATTGNFAAGLTYLNYGSFTETDASGIIMGSFSAAEYAFPIIYSREIDSLFTVGATFKPVLSHLEKYTSFGFALDIGAAWHNLSKLLSAGVVIKNIGYQVTTYAGEPRQNLPFEIQAGLTQRLAHAPFRFSLTLRHLEKFDLTHQYNETVLSGNADPISSDFFENLMRHIVIGAELIPHKNFYFSGGYNYQRRSELQVDSKVSTVGFSWGFGINTSWMDIEFGRATFHLAGSSSHISLILRPDNIYKKYRN